MTRFRKLTIRGDEIVTDQDSGRKVFHASDSHSFIQAAGYLKYICAQENGKTVYYRGQGKLYDRLSPSLFRGVKQQATEEDRIRRMRSYVDDARSNLDILDSLPHRLVEPLLQHYGLRTTWLDLVDNVWVALWFACHSAYTTGPANQYLHFERRDRKNGDQDQYVYVVCVKAGKSDSDSLQGVFEDEETSVVDLRLATPSVFVRPHAQHGVLFKLKRDMERRRVDYSPSVAGVIRVELRDAIDWIGDGRLLNTHSLFPPPHYDNGYRLLLRDAPERDNHAARRIGGIHHVGT
jgi:hypothetical protein